MSGIYISGMEMPQRDEVITIYPDGTAHRHHLGLRLRISESKAIPVPEHGRLGDLDDLKVKIKKEDNGYSWDSYGDGMYDAFQSVYQCIDAAPTIVPASKEGE